MKKVTIKNRAGIQTHGAEMEDPSAWIAQCEAVNAWGKPERWQPEKNGDSSPLIPSYDLDDVIDSEDRMDLVTGELVHWVKLRAEYTIEIEDITYEHDLAECIANRVSEYPRPEEFMNAFFDGGQDALDELQALRLAIKAKYPKPVKD